MRIVAGLRWRLNLFEMNRDPDGDGGSGCNWSTTWWRMLAPIVRSSGALCLFSVPSVSKKSKIHEKITHFHPFVKATRRGRSRRFTVDGSSARLYAASCPTRSAPKPAETAACVVPRGARWAGVTQCERTPVKLIHAPILHTFSQIFRSTDRNHRGCRARTRERNDSSPERPLALRGSERRRSCSIQV